MPPNDAVTYAAGMLFGDSVSHNQSGIANPGGHIDDHVVGVKRGSLQSTTSNTGSNLDEDIISGSKLQTHSAYAPMKPKDIKYSRIAISTLI